MSDVEPLIDIRKYYGHLGSMYILARCVGGGSNRACRSVTLLAFDMHPMLDWLTQKRVCASRLIHFMLGTKVVFEHTNQRMLAQH